MIKDALQWGPNLTFGAAMGDKAAEGHLSGELINSYITSGALCRIIEVMERINGNMGRAAASLDQMCKLSNRKSLKRRPKSKKVTAAKKET
jgi:hypothetical protein